MLAVYNFKILDFFSALMRGKGFFITNVKNKTYLSKNKNIKANSISWNQGGNKASDMPFFQYDLNIYVKFLSKKNLAWHIDYTLFFIAHF